MNPVIDEETWASVEQRRWDVWRVQQASKRERRIFDDYHPEAIREKIAALQALLADAGV